MPGTVKCFVAGEPHGQDRLEVSPKAAQTRIGLPGVLGAVQKLGVKMRVLLAQRIPRRDEQ